MLSANKGNYVKLHIRIDAREPLSVITCSCQSTR